MELGQRRAAGVAAARCLSVRLLLVVIVVAAAVWVREYGAPCGRLLFDFFLNVPLPLALCSLFEIYL